MTRYEKIYANFFYQFSNYLRIYINNPEVKIIFLCIGTSKIIGDSFGPLVGDKLKKELDNNKYIILGDLNENVSALNINKRLNIIKNKYSNTFIISIDSALSKREDIGKIQVYPYGIRIRSALEEKYKKIGDLSIKAIVATDYKKSVKNYLELKNTPFTRVEYLANLTVEGIKTAIINSNA